MSNTTRDMFEVWAHKEGYSTLREEDGETYDDQRTHCGWWAWQAAQSQPAPPVPQTVQEIMRLMNPYVAACIGFAIPKHNRDHLDDAAKVQAAFAPIEAALTALVDENHRLKFELDGVRAMRRPLTDQQDISGWWNSVKDSLAWSGAIVGLEWAELWPEAQDMLKALVKATPGIEPEQR